MTGPLIELRQYLLHPGGREVLTELFDREFLATQETVGMAVLGQFHDLDRPDRFVWLRGFADNDVRLAGLTAFYGGPVWAAHRDAANATMIDSDDVLLLRPADPAITDPNVAVSSAPDFPPVGSPPPGTLFTAAVYPAAGPAEEEKLLGLLRERAGRPLAELRTSTAPNTFPALPVREGEHVVVRLARHDGAAAPAAYRDADVDALLAGPPRLLRLTPTGRSRLR